jgi:DNA-directed RNA polymerase subunit RPC12/RpoP
MKEERCGRCLSGHFRPTINPDELKCNYCGWTRIAMNLGEYVACKGKVGNIHNLNN